MKKGVNRIDITNDGRRISYQAGYGNSRTVPGDDIIGRFPSIDPPIESIEFGCSVVVRLEQSGFPVGVNTDGKARTVARIKGDEIAVDVVLQPGSAVVVDGLRIRLRK